MGIFKKDEKLGYQPIQKVIPVKIKKNVIISKQLHYKYVLPEGFAVEDHSGRDKWDGKKDYTEFAATYRGARISVNIIPNDFPESMRHSWDSSEKRITAAIIKSIYVDADVNQIEYRDFLGLNCAHYGGITNKKCSDGHMLYMEQYIYCAPCCMVTFVATSEEYENYNIYRAFDNFTKI